jgi:hypothetical protein
LRVENKENKKKKNEKNGTGGLTVAAGHRTRRWGRCTPSPLRSSLMGAIAPPPVVLVGRGGGGGVVPRVIVMVVMAVGRRALMLW